MENLPLESEGTQNKTILWTSPSALPQTHGRVTTRIWFAECFKNISTLFLMCLFINFSVSLH